MKLIPLARAYRPTPVAGEPAPSVHVDVIWNTDGVPLDRPSTYSISVGTWPLAERLVKAIHAGVVFPDPKVKTDVYGKTYVEATCKVMGRYLNADLKRLGY